MPEKEPLIIKLSSGTRFKITQSDNWVGDLLRAILEEHMGKLERVGDLKLTRTHAPGRIFMSPQATCLGHGGDPILYTPQSVSPRQQISFERRLYGSL